VLLAFGDHMFSQKEVGFKRLVKKTTANVIDNEKIF